MERDFNVQVIDLKDRNNLRGWSVSRRRSLMESMVMKDKKGSPSGCSPEKKKNEQETLLACINKVLAGQFLKTMRVKACKAESFDCSPPLAANDIQQKGTVVPFNNVQSATCDSSLHQS